MNHSGDAAEQIVRFSLEGVEVAAKIAGAGAKSVATFLFAALKNKNKNKLKGKSRLTSMLKSGKELKVFAIKDSELKKFAQEAKRYGVVYCVLRDRKGSSDGLCDVMVRAEDASKVNRIADRFDIATVDSAAIKSEIVQAKEEQAAQPGKPEAESSERNAPDQDDTDKLLDDIMGSDEGKAAPEKAKTEPQAPENPEAAKNDFFTDSTAKSRPFEPTFGNNSKSEKGISEKKESVKVFLERATARRKETDTPKRDNRQRDDRPKSGAQKGNTHRQPQNIRRKEKSKKAKER